MHSINVHTSIITGKSGREEEESQKRKSREEAEGEEEREKKRARVATEEEVSDVEAGETMEEEEEVDDEEEAEEEEESNLETTPTKQNDQLKSTQTSNWGDHTKQHKGGLKCILRCNFQVKQTGGLISVEAYYLGGSCGKDGLNQLVQYMRNQLSQPYK